MARERNRANLPATPRRILAAAERIFAERGLAGARTDEIAAAARVNKALLYYYFRGKERLYRAVLENLFGKLRASVADTDASSASPRERLLAFVNGYLDFVATHPNYPRTVQREVMERGSHLRWIVREYLRPLHQQLRKTIEAGIARGQFRRVDPHHTVFTIIAMSVFYFAAAPVLSEIMRHDALRPRQVAARRQAILDFLEHGLFRPSARPLRPKARRS